MLFDLSVILSTFVVAVIKFHIIILAFVREEVTADGTKILIVSDITATRLTYIRGTVTKIQQRTDDLHFLHK